MENFLQASFKGQPVLVMTSDIRSGQKTVVHEYPNTNRTEVETLGRVGDRFSLQLVIKGRGDAYTVARNEFKRVLGQDTPGILVHPVEGAVKVNVVDGFSLSEDLQRRVGVAIFNVTFIKFFEPLYPEETTNNAPKIRDITDKLIDSLGSDIADNFDATGSSQLYDLALTKVESFASTFESALGSINIDATKAVDLKSLLTSFQENIPSLITQPNQLAAGMTGLFKELDLIAPTKDNQLRMLSEFFSFGGSTADIDLRDTFFIRKSRENDSLINNMALLSSLGLGYKTASLIDYANVPELDSIFQTLETQYVSIINNDDVVPDDTRTLTQDLRNNFRLFRDNKSEEIFDVIDIDIPVDLPITKVAYDYYGSTETGENLLNLNDRTESVFIKGSTKVLSDEQVTT